MKNQRAKNAKIAALNFRGNAAMLRQWCRSIAAPLQPAPII